MRANFICVLLCLSLAGCAGTLEVQPSNVPVVPVEAVLNSLKCGLAEALVRDTRNRTGLQGAVAKIELDANVILGVDASGKISVGIPVFGGLGSVTPSIGFTHSEVRTLNSSVDFDIHLDSRRSTICARVVRGQDSGFSIWIGAVVASVNAAVGGPPHAQMKQYVYESDFTVKTGETAGVDVEIVPVKLSTSFGSSRSDVQHMKITIDAVHFEKDKKGKLVPKPGGRRFHPVAMPADAGPRSRRGHFNLPVQ